jgi:hypothetical protein
VNTHKEEYIWLLLDEQNKVYYCDYCRKFSMYNSAAFKVGSDNLRKVNLEKHALSKDHESCYKEYKSIET